MTDAELVQKMIDVAWQANDHAPVDGENPMCSLSTVSEQLPNRNEMVAALAVAKPEIEKTLLQRARHSINPNGPDRVAIIEWLDTVAKEHGIDLEGK